MRSFFYGFAKQNPGLFLGGGLKLSLRQVGVFFVFIAAKLRHFVVK